MDIKDIMGIKGDKGPAAKKMKEATQKKPEGVSREVWQITKGMAQDALAPVVPTHAGLKGKRKVTARKVAWSWQPFKNSARADTLMLRHWVKTGTGGTMLPGSNGRDVGGDYAFSKYNKKVDMVMAGLLAPEGEVARASLPRLFIQLSHHDFVPTLLASDALRTPFNPTEP